MQVAIFDLDHTLFTAENALHEGASELLVILHRLGVHVAGLSNRDHRVLVRLDEAGMRQYFDSVLCTDHDVDPKGKDGVRHLLKQAGAEPHQAALISHAHADILLGKEAGLAKTIGVTHGKDSLASLQDAEPDHIIANIPAVLDVLE